MRTLGLGVTALPGNLTRRGVLARYAAVTGREVEGPVFYYVYGLFKVAVIAQQIHARYVAGLTHDPRFAHLDQAVRTLGEAAVAAIDRGDVGGEGR
jgi:aminoglycoside phosphotransferase (APT) family kinase protein